MAAPILTAERLREVFSYNPEDGVFTRLIKTPRRAKIGALAPRITADGYIAIGLDGKQYLAHRLAWLYMTGDFPQKRVRHADGNPINNAWKNLSIESTSDKHLSLTHDFLLSILDYDERSGIFTWKVSRNNRHKKGSQAGKSKSGRYIRISIRKRNYSAHRLAWFYVHESWPVNCIDHINGDRTDNRISNLRDVTIEVNSQNQRRPMPTNRTSGLIGVHWAKSSKRWRAQISIKGKPKYLGLFKDKNDAHQAYLNAKREYHAGCTI